MFGGKDSVKGEQEFGGEILATDIHILIISFASHLASGAVMTAAMRGRRRRTTFIFGEAEHLVIIEQGFGRGAVRISFAAFYIASPTLSVWVST